MTISKLKDRSLEFQTEFAKAFLQGYKHISIDLLKEIVRIENVITMLEKIEGYKNEC
mgnify:FL=1